MSRYTSEDLEIINNISVLHYFNYLEKQGKVKFEKESRQDNYFRTDNGKFSVTDKQFYDFKTGEGGKIIKAVMTMENKSWKEAVDFLKEFSGYITQDLSAENRHTHQKKASSNSASIGSKITPNNERLLDFFAQRGISKEVLQEHTSQIHYAVSSRDGETKKYFGIGMENESGGYEIRNPRIKTKIGKSDISIIPGNKPELIVFEGMTDTLSFLQLLKNNNTANNRSLVTLNSVVNADKFIEKYKNFEGKIFLCLDGDKAGNEATNKIMSTLQNINVKDVRMLYDISEEKHNDLNDYLKKKVFNLQNQKNEQDVTNTNRPTEISNTGQDGTKLSQQHTGGNDKESEPEQDRDSAGRQGVDGNNVGNGLAGSVGADTGISNGTGRPIDSSQQNDVGKDEAGEHQLVGRLKNSTNISELDALISKYIGQKLTNEQVAEVVSATCFVSEDNKILLRESLSITDELKDICNQFKSGGVAKEGRGILDEYYTDVPIVDTIRNLIKNDFKDHHTIEVLEPSVGTGNFIYAAKGFSANTYVTAFEINEVTAKIAKIFHPHTDVNLRSFETEFIDDSGIKKDESTFLEKYDLIIGNPPYGEHRGLYKGLGEESKISKYEDYFVKRSLDVLKDKGVLAMVLPSAWLNRQKKLGGADIVNAYRLPNGAFSGTQVGTDIIILRKNSLKHSQNISNYFELNPDKILGELREKSNRFGRMEPYVYGSLDEALQRIEKLETNRSATPHIGNLFEDFFTEQKEDAEKKVNSTSTKKENIENNSNEITEKAKEKVAEALLKLNDIKFKSAAVKAEISKYEKLEKTIETLSSDKLSEAIKDAEKISKLHNKPTNDREYRQQSNAEIKKGILKYQFLKNDIVVPTSLQNSPDITERQIEAFRDTNYDGLLENVDKHKDFANYADGNWIHDFYYTEGNIYEKLKQLELDFEDKDSLQYLKQKEMLEKVLPKPKELDEIIISPNHEFVHNFGLGMIEKEQWNHNTRKTETVIVPHNLAEKFKDFVSKLPSEAFAGSSSWEVKSFVDNETVTGSDKERNALVRERRKAAANDLFYKFVREELSDVVRERFVKEFNTNYNNIHVPDYSKFPLFSKIHQNFKGKELKLTEVQKAGIGRQTTKGVGLLAHEVGFGKTLSGILSMHEAMERGNAKRPLIVVPNDSILKQWVDTIFETIPNAKVNVLGNLGRDYDLSKFDNKDGEISIVTYEGFNNIGFSKEITERLASKFNYISTSELKSITNSERDGQKELQKEKEIEGKMKRGKVYDWEDFKFDHLTYDEVHNANHIVGKVKIEDRRFSSDFRNQNQQTSKLGINTWMAAQYIQEQQDGRNVTLLSATPFTNKPLEYYSILSLIANKRLEESGYFNVNNFFETFMEADNDMEIDAKGDVKFKANVRRFKNNSLFQQLLSEFIDVKGEEDNLELVRPNKVNKEYRIEQNDLTKEQYEMLNENFSEAEKGAILTHILNARLIAISPYLSPFYSGEEPSVKEFVEESPKLNDTMNLIRQNKKDIPDSGQIIYSELAVSQFPKLKDYLVTEVGYKAEEVGIITGATSKNQRIAIQDDFNNGKIKIIIGSEAIQEGMNLQVNTSDLYLLSLPYNFTSLRQVEGRAWRQGNINENVRVNFMLTNDSIDVFMLQKLQAKQARYLEAMKKGANVLDISDINTQELKTSIITKPETRANIEIELLKKKIESEKSRFVADSAFVLRKYEEYNKSQEMVAREELSYNRILGYAKEDGVNSDYWQKQLPNYERNVELAKEYTQKVIEKLAEKGVNVLEIEKQTKLTEEKISALDEQIEKLPERREELIAQYQMEKEERTKENLGYDIVAERKIENKTLFASKIIPISKSPEQKTDTSIYMASVAAESVQNENLPKRFGR